MKNLFDSIIESELFMAEESNFKKLSNEQIMLFMAESKNVNDWNNRREKVKQIRDILFISRWIDSSGFIKCIL